VPRSSPYLIELSAEERRVLEERAPATRTSQEGSRAGGTGTRP